MNQPADWKVLPLSAVVAIQRGFDLPHHARRPGPYPVLTSGDTGGFHDEGPISGPGVTIGRATNLGKPKWSDGNFWPHNTTMFVKDFMGNDPRWVFHLFENTDLAGYNSGSVQPMLNRNYIAQVPVLVPPVSVQRDISKLLGALDEKIAANNKLADRADEYIKAQHQVAITASKTKTQRLFEVFDVEFGEAYKGTGFSEPGTGRPLIRIRDLKTFSSQVWTTETRPNEVTVEPGDVLIGMDAEFRPTTWLGEPGMLNQRVCRVRGLETGPAFVRESLKAPMGYVENYKTGTTVIHLNKTDLQRCEITIPNEYRLRRFEQATEGLYKCRVLASNETRRLAATRRVLLPHLMSGKLLVKDAEKVIEAVV